MGAGGARFLRHKVHQVVDVQHVARRKDAGDAGLEAFVDGGAARHGVQGHTGGAAQLVFGQQPAGEEQGVAGIVLLGAGHRLAVFHPSQGDPLHPFLALNVHHGVAEFEGDAEVVQTLDDVALDEPDVAGAEDDHLAPRQIALDIDEALGRAGGKDARRAVAGDVQRAPGAFPAAHGQHHRLGMELEQAVLPVHRRDGLVRRKVQHHRVEFVGDAQRLGLPDEPVGVFGAGEFLLKGVQAEPAVDALVENAPQLAVPFQHQQVLHPLPAGFHRRGQPRRAAADDDKIYLFHPLRPPLNRHPCWYRR